MDYVITLCCILKETASGRGKIIFSPPECPEELWGPPSLLCKGYRDSFLRKSGWGVVLNTHLHLMLRLRISGAIPLLLLYDFMA